MVELGLLQNLRHYTSKKIILLTFSNGYFPKRYLQSYVVLSYKHKLIFCKTRIIIHKCFNIKQILIDNYNKDQNRENSLQIK